MIHNKKALLILRDNYDWIVNPNKWEFPGGMQEEDESFLETCIREVREEVNVKLISPYFLGEIEKPKGTFHHQYIEYLNDFQAQSARKGDEGADMGFFTYKELLKLELTPKLTYLRDNCPDIMKYIIEGDCSSIEKIKTEIQKILMQI